MFCIIIVFLSLFSIVVDCENIGQIENYRIIGNLNTTLFNQTKDECICQMLKSNNSIFALNYFQINQTCQLFYYYSNSIFIQWNINSLFIFINQSSMSIITIQIDESIMSTPTTSITSITSSISNTAVPVNVTYSCNEHTLVNLTCTNSMTLTIIYAFYGVISCSDCSCNYCQCKNMNVTPIIIKQCQNLSLCTFTASNALFNDSCPNNYKIFEITYYCT